MEAMSGVYQTGGLSGQDTMRLVWIKCRITFDATSVFSLQRQKRIWFIWMVLQELWASCAHMQLDTSGIGATLLLVGCLLSSHNYHGAAAF
jgi:hypothetical protein